MQGALNSKEQEVEVLQEAVDSAKGTIISQNEHITHQNSSMRQLKKRLQSSERDHGKQKDALQREIDKLQGRLERYFLSKLIIIRNLLLLELAYSKAWTKEKRS